MYRGQLVLRGNPRIKPTDIVYVYDLKNMIWGPIEVERVTHTFNSQEGFVTTIKPKCYVEVNNYDGGLTSVILNAGYDVAGLAIPLAAGLATAVVGGFTPMGLAFGIGAWQSARKITDSSVAYLKRHKFGAQVVGGPTWAEKHTPVRIYPLSRMGARVRSSAASDVYKRQPWVAALDGMLEAKSFTQYVSDKFEERWGDAVTGVERLYELAKTAMTGFEDEGESD